MVCSGTVCQLKRLGVVMHAQVQRVDNVTAINHGTRLIERHRDTYSPFWTYPLGTVAPRVLHPCELHILGRNARELDVGLPGAMQLMVDVPSQCKVPEFFKIIRICLDDGPCGKPFNVDCWPRHWGRRFRAVMCVPRVAGSGHDGALRQ